jgi:LacI family transcriptional regulator
VAKKRGGSGSATITDVARLAGVSVATASKALNRRDDVASDTRQRVLDAAEELAFQPNALARGLISGRTRTVGLLTDELRGRFAIPILVGVENALGNQQMSVLLCDTRGDAIRRGHYIRTLLARQVDGLIVVGETNDVRPSLTADISVPVIYVYGESDDPNDLSILADDYGGGRLAGEHLIGHGCRAIAHISGEQSYRAARERAAGLQSVLDEAGLPLVGGTLYGDWTQPWARRAAQMLLSVHPDIDAIFCASDQIATGVLTTLHDLGRRVPEDIAVVGYDNWEVFAAESRPTLTTIDLNLTQIGELAAMELSAALDGKKSSGVIRCPTRLVVRESTGLRIAR